MTDIQIHDKIIPQGYADQIEADILRWQFNWNYVNDVTNPDYGNNSGLVHMAYNHNSEPSPWYPFIKPLVYAITEAQGIPLTELYRIRVGFLMPNDQPEYDHNTPHVDFFWPHYTACYYVNDSDGDTVLFDQTTKEVGNALSVETLNEYVAKTTFTEAARCEPKKGRVCIFSGDRFHSSTKPRNHSRRLVITVNYR